MTGMASGMSACSAPCTVMSNEPSFSSPPAMTSAADAENEPGSMTIDVPSFSATTQACSCLVSFIGASLRPAQRDHVADGPDARFRLVDMNVVPGVPGVDLLAGGGGGRELLLQLGAGGQAGGVAGE